MSRLALLVLPLLLVGSCTDGGTEGGARDLSTRCTDDRQCSGRTPRCDLDSGRCVACTADSHCPSDTVCRGGACVRGCSLQRGCGDAGACDVDAGVCRVCALDADCPVDAPRCDAATGRCHACLPDPADGGTGAPDNCPSGRVCVLGDDGYACVNGCKSDGDCGPKGGDGGGAGRWSCCDHQCVDLDASKSNCGACGASCNFPAACCASQCNDYQSDKANCGACGKACVLANAAAACTAGKCAVAACTQGFADCNMLPSDGCEVDLARDPRNCGGCGMACMVPNAFAGCDSGCTVMMCKTGFADCDLQAGNGCEIDLTQDARNCGGCGTSCIVPHAAAGCTGGACVVASCNGSFANCDKDEKNGCEVDIASDVGNCGGCGKGCPMPPGGVAACTAGACAVAMCMGTLADCDAKFANGCEADLMTDVGNCGGCGKGCTIAHGMPGCVMGACAVAACAMPWADCNMMPGDGCETDTSSSVAACGGCGMACPALANATAGCSMGACVIAACAKNFADCNGLIGDGCEAALLTDSNNCGGCGTSCNGQQACVGGKCAFRDYGTGVDGPLSVQLGQTYTIPAPRTPATGTAGSMSLTVSSTSGFVPGQTVLVHQSQGQGAGTWELATVQSAGMGQVQLVAALQHTYFGGGNNHAQVLVVPQYTDVTVAVGGTLTGNAWDGTTGGILALQATGTVTIAGTTTMDGKGFRGSAHGCLYRCQHGFAGESATGPATYGLAANGAGGGGGGAGQDCGMGAGGGYGTSGGIGTNYTSGNCNSAALGNSAGGGSVGAADLTQAMLFGGAGGEGGADEDGAYPGAGGNGGGIVVLLAQKLVITGTVTTSGLKGLDGVSGGCNAGGCGMSGGGGGAGGGVRIVSTNATLGVGLVVANGGGGGACTCGGRNPGGGGGQGRVAVRSPQITGSTVPAHFGG